MSKRATKKKAVEQVEAVEEVTEKKVRKTVDPIELNKTQQKTYSEFKTKSEQIRYLAAEGFKNGQIALFMGIRYQHVRNVLTTPLKRVQA